MKKLLVIFFMIPLFISGQDWNLINPTYHYHYRNTDSSYITNTIFVVQTSYVGGNTVYYLNRVGNPCDTCEQYSQNETYFFLINQPQFLQRSIIKTDSNFIFSDTSHFTIYTQKDSGFTWQFDDTIFATIIDITPETTLGISDTIKTILLSTNDTIIISKNFGIKYFSSPYEHIKYELVGVETPSDTLGLHFPNFYDFLNFNIGDVFMYVKDGGDFDYSNDTFKIIIQDKEISGDTIRYQAHKVGKHLYIDYYGSYHFSTYNKDTTIEYINKENSYVNLYNKAICYEYDTHVGSGGFGNNYILSYCYLDTNDNSYTKSSFCKNCDISFPILYENNYDNYANPVILEYNPEYRYKLFYKSGLGLTLKEYSDFEYGFRLKLIGYVKNGDTTGIVYSDGYLLRNSYIDVPGQKISIYPNPANNELFISFKDNTPEQTIKLLDMQGNLIQEKIRKTTGLIKINTSSLPQGNYIIKCGKFSKQITVVH